MDVSNQVNKEWVDDILRQRKIKHKNSEMGLNEHVWEAICILS